MKRHVRPNRPACGKLRQLRRLAAAVTLIAFVLVLGQPLALNAQEGPSNPKSALGPEPTPGRVEVRAQTEDSAISDRLVGILAATEWFDSFTVRTEEGVVFLGGVAESEQRKAWASELARNTEDVVAVVNQMRVRVAPIWDFSPAVESLRSLLRTFVLGLPSAGFALFILAVTYFVARLSRAGIEYVTKRRVPNLLLRRVLARTASTLVLLLGVYIVLRVSGLTRLAVSVLGGTGVIGLILGIAFRDISENFLASIFLSVQKPFQVDDLVEVAGNTGYVQRTTYRVTVLATLDGQQVQVPNSTVYKSIIRNFTSHRNRREVFDVGIGFDVPISKAQEVARSVLASHPAVLNEPEPWVLVDSLGAAAVVLRVYFWLDGTEHSWLKVRSSVIRLIKRAFQDAGISMPDEAREVVFPNGVPLRMMQGPPVEAPLETVGRSVSPDESGETASAGEAQLRSEAAELKEQTAKGRPADDGSENLLTSQP